MRNFSGDSTSAQTTATTPDAQPLPSELANFNTAWLAARNAGDKGSLDRMTTEDFRYTDESGRVLEKAEFLKSAEPLPPDDQSRFEDVEIRGLEKTLLSCLFVLSKLIGL